MIGTYIIILITIIFALILIKVRVLKILMAIIIVMNVSFLLLIYTNNYIKTTLITTSMSTKSHQYIAKLFFSNDEINKVLNKNKVVEEDEVSDLSEINISNSKTGYELKKIKGKGYRGYLVLIYDPDKIEIAYSKNILKEGAYITDIAKENNAEIVINASGYYDPNWDSNGAIPHGILIKNNKIISDYKDADMGGGIIGITGDHKLFLGNIKKEDINKYDVKDAIAFGPYLIINGKKTKIMGDGGLGIAPRTAIAQRRDGTFIFLVIDGRMITSIGVDLVELQNILYKHGAYNAANLDGGSSSELLINGKIINKPVGGSKNGLKKMPTYFILKNA